MLLITAVALALLGAPAVQNEDARVERPRVASSTPSRAISARAPTLPDGPTRVVCGREKALDSNIMRRVCRETPVNTSERERMGGEVLRDIQGARFSEGMRGGLSPGHNSNGGRPVG